MQCGCEDAVEADKDVKASDVVHRNPAKCHHDERPRDWDEKIELASEVGDVSRDESGGHTDTVDDDQEDCSLREGEAECFDAER